MIFKKMKSSPILLMLPLLLSLSTASKAIDSKTVLTYSPTSMNQGLKLQLAPKYKTHCGKEKQDKVRKKILSTPKELVAENVKILDSLQNNSSLVTPEWFARITAQNPVCLLGECTSEGCHLNRLKTSLRENFENEFGDSINNGFDTFDKQKDTFNYTSYACGTFFPDLIMVTKLIDQGFKKIHINLLDVDFREYIETLKVKDGSVSLDIFDSYDKKGYWLRLKTYSLLQFFAWFANDIDLSISIYDSAQGYITECIAHPELMSDVIVGIDYVEDTSRPIVEFALLSLIGLKKGQRAFYLYGSCGPDANASGTYKKISDVSVGDTEPIVKVLNLLSNYDNSSSLDSLMDEVGAIIVKNIEQKEL